ncbi:MAG: alpha-glucosidase/alpha-galactosidase, partial [Candidatus Bathyarchaeota archaeon]|nr:alpha-glucosidase/alpha-galactosidase [Candidatus Termitimicrobium sp.]
MNYQNNKATDIQITYIGGGSRGWAWAFMTDLALDETMSGTIRLYDIDLEAAGNNKIIGNRISDRPDAVGKWNYEIYSDLNKALEGADFVVISILPGTFDEMEVDVHLPERLGVYQPVGDTVGPGGMMRALRTIPMFAHLAKSIKQSAPNAWVINYTNPMSICVQTLYDTFPEIKAFGCCHEVFGTQELLKKMVEEKFGLNDIVRSDIKVNVLGINHFTWFDYASYKGIDLFPLYDEFVEANYERGYGEENEHWANSYFTSNQRVKFDLFKRFGYIAAAGDRHLAEFMPGSEYLNCPATVKHWGFALTPVSWRKTDLEGRMARGNRLANAEEEVKLTPTGEEGILLIKALCGLEAITSNVIIPNTNRQITNLPITAIVESNAVFERDSIRPVIAGEMPENIKTLTMPHIENMEYIMEASKTLNKELIVKAFL